MTIYQLTCEGYVLRDGDTKVPITGPTEFLSANPDYIKYKEWIAAGNTPLPPDPQALAQVLARAKDELRELRAPMLDAVNGIGWRASMKGDTALASEALALSEALLDITSDAALNSAQTYDDMRAAGIAAYKRLASTVSPVLASVFREITGA